MGNVIHLKLREPFNSWREDKERAKAALAQVTRERDEAVAQAKWLAEVADAMVPTHCAATLQDSSCPFPEEQDCCMRHPHWECWLAVAAREARAEKKGAGAGA